MILGPLYKKDSKGKIRVYSVEVDGGKYRMITGLEDGAKVTSKWTLTLPKNLGKANATSAEDQALKEATAKYNKKLKAHYFDTKEGALHEESFFKVMLATEDEKVDMDALWEKYPYLIADPKLDGMRLFSKPGKYHSRTGKPVITAQWIQEDLEPLFKIFPNIALDGELYNHSLHDNFEGMMKLARRTHISEEQEKAIKADLHYYVYDMFNFDVIDMNAIERKEWLAKTLTIGPRVKLVPYTKVHNAQELEIANKFYLDQGYEGTILRVPTSPYENKRSKNLIKVKKFITKEFPIIDILTGKGNKGDIAGRVIVDVNGKSVGCSIRGSWDRCKFLLEKKDDLIGVDATIRFFEWTEDGSLRFPVCIDIERWNYE